jgi:branched-chain amino acid transport system permease protein
VKELLFAALLGIGGGGVYAMLGTGIVTAYKGSGVINFAHGAFAMYAAFTYDELLTKGSLALPWVDILPTKGLNLPVHITIQDGGTSEWVAVALGLLMAAAIGLLGHLLVFRPLRNAPALGKVIGSVGLMLYLQAVALLNFGSGGRAPEGFVPKEPIVNFLGLGENMPRLNLYLAGAAVLMGLAVWALLRFSRFGLATRAADEKEKDASLLGYSPQWLAGLNWVLSAVLAGIVGLLFVGSGSLDTTGFTELVIPALGAALLGGLTSIPLATIGGLGLGMFQAGMVELTERSWWPTWLPGAGVRELIPLVVIATYLFFRGAGLPVRGTVVQRRLPRAPEPRHVLIGAAIPAVIALGLSAIFTSDWEVALTTSILATLLMLSWIVITGYLGQISLVQVSLAGLAAFVAAKLAANVEKVSEFDLLSVTGPNFPDPIAALLGIAAAVGLGLLIGLPAMRIRGVQLAVVTAAAAGPIGLLLLKNESIFGEAAVSNYPIPPPHWFGTYVGATDPESASTDYWHFTVFAVIVTVLVALGVASLRRGATGRRFLAVRANERAAAAAGINVARTKLLGFAIAAGIAGLAGVLQSYRLGTIRPESYGLFASLATFAFVYLGGITSLYGAVVGGLLVGGGLVAQIINEHASGGFEQYVPVVGAVGLILTAILNPEGIAPANAAIGKGLWNRLRRPRTVAVAEPATSELGPAPAGGH